MNKKIFFLCFFCNLFFSYGQQQFNYNFYVYETVREGSLFYDVEDNTAIYLDKISSMKKVNKKKDEENSDTEIIQASFNGNLDFYFIKNKNEVLFTYNLLKSNYLVEDKLPKMEWELNSEKREIDNLICYKATTTFRGRTWIAWYSPDIPISYGPWKFYGLPGLVVEIKDDTNKFGFILTNYALNSKKFAPTINLKKIKQISMKKMAEITDEAYDNMLNVLSSSEPGETKVTLVKEESNTDRGEGIESKYEWEETPKKE